MAAGFKNTRGAQQYDGPERREQGDKPGGWHLDKKVPISLIMALLVYGATGLWYVADIKKDIELLKMSTLEQRDRDKRQDEQVANAMMLLRGQLERMENKMDRVLEAKR